MSLPLVVGFGGGVNSTAMLVGLRVRGERPNAIVFADTGGEKPTTYAFLAILGEWLQDAGFPALQIVRYPSRKDLTLEAECRRLRVLPSRTYGYGSCSAKWKVDPQARWLRQSGLGRVIRAIGFDAGEPARAIRMGDALPNGDVARFPLIEWDWGREECIVAIRDAGLPIPPKSACFFCPSTKKHEVLALAREAPELFARAIAMEDAALAKGQAQVVKGLGRHWSWRDLVTAKDPSSLPEPPEAACACYDGDANDD